MQEQLEYKTKWNNKVLIKINELSISGFECKKCKCNNERDINASFSILDEGIRIAINKGLIIV